MYSRSMVEVEATYTMLQTPIYKGFEGYYGTRLHVFTHKLFCIPKISKITKLSEN